VVAQHKGQQNITDWLVTMTADFDLLPVAVRVYPTPPLREKHDRKPPKAWRRPNSMFVFDTETRIDATQRLTFGSYRFILTGRCVEEGLFYADDLPDGERKLLEEYASTRQADTTGKATRMLKLLTRAEFMTRLYKAAYKSRCLLVGFNLPFDLSRIAFDFTTARGRFAGGFSLGLWSFSKDGREQRNQFRPRVCIKHIDSKRALNLGEHPKPASRDHLKTGQA
jgi:hypothetical protein